MTAKPKSMRQEIREALTEAWREVRGVIRGLTKRIPLRWRSYLSLAGRVVLWMVIVVSLAGGFAMYALGWENQFTRFVGRYVPYPATISLHGLVSFSDYATEVERIKTYSKQTGVSITARQANQQALSQRLNVTAVEHLAAKKKVTVTSDELAKEYNRIVQAYGGEKATLDVLRKQYNTSKDQYRSLIREQLLRQKTEAAWSADTVSLEDARSQATAILRDVQGGADFNTLASRYSQDVTAGNQGDTALVDAATLPDNVATAVKAIKDGEVVPRALEANNAYYLVKRVKTQGDTIQVRGIVIKPLSFDRRLADETSAARVVRLLWLAR